MTPDDAVVELERAGIRIGGRTLFEGLDLRVGPGEFVAVLGQNGSGKTTLFRVLLGLQPLSAGRARVFGAPPRRGSRRIGYVPQQRIIQPETPMRGRDLVMLGRTGTRFGLPITTSADRRAATAAIAAVGGERLTSRPVGDLSGGEQQRLRIAQAIVDEPALLLLDEPLSSLDQDARTGIVALAAAQRERGAAVLVITHDIDPVLGVADRIVELAPEGCWVGTPAEAGAREFHDHPHHPDEQDGP